MGGLGVAPSGDVNERMGVFAQPCTAPDIAGKGIANPAATILLAAMLLDWLAEQHDDTCCAEAAATVRNATAQVLASGPKTGDIHGKAGTKQVTDAIVDAMSSAK